MRLGGGRQREVAATGILPMSTLIYHPQSPELGRRTRLDAPVAPLTPATTVSEGPVVSSPAWIVRLLSGRRLLVASVAGALLAGAGWSWKQHGFGATSAPSNQYATTEKLVLHSVQRHLRLTMFVGQQNSEHGLQSLKVQLKTRRTFWHRVYASLRSAHLQQTFATGQSHARVTLTDHSRWTAL